MADVEGAAVPAVRLCQISRSFGAVRANDQIDLDIAPGTIHGIIGENGAGKSTLVSILYGFYTADSGTIEIDGELARIDRPADAIARGIGMVHQHFMLVPTFTVLENVMLGAEGGALLAQGAADVRAELLRLEQEHGLEVDPDALTGDLPVGLQQRVEILKALRRGARILILDEPTGVLTPAETEAMFAILRALRDSGVTILLITHKLGEVMAICDAVSVMRQGRMVGQRVPAQTSREELAELMVGRQVTLDAQPTEARTGAATLSVRDLSWRDANGAPRLRDVSLELRAGEILGLAGVSGNGQSELLDVLAGLAPVQQGKIELAGRIIDAAHPADPADMRQLGLAHVPEDRHRRALVLPFEARENAVLGYPKRLGSGPWARPTTMTEIAQPLMQGFDVRPPNPKLAARGFSGGNQQKLVLAREISARPKVLLVGQPTRGVDIGAIEFIHAQLNAMKAEGCAILLVSVELDEILALSDRVAVMNAGAIVGTLDRQDATVQRLGLMMAGQAA
ncbi:MAG: ABC transporter ATP-binding protein [Pseudomonadota bacterium]